MRKLIGFEFEFGAKKDVDHSRIIGRSLGRDDKKLVVEWEDYESLDMEFNFEEWEVRSAPMAKTRGLKFLKNFLKPLQNRQKFNTNSSCGLHIGMSLPTPEQTLAVDPLDLMMLFDDEKWLKVFDREKSEVAMPHFAPCLRRHQSTTWGSFKRKRRRLSSVEDFKRLVKIHPQKYSSVNFTKVAEYVKHSNSWLYEDFEEENGYKLKPYWEIRIAGGEDYQFHYSNIARMIQEFSQAVDKVIAGVSNREINNRVRKLLNENCKEWKTPVVPH